MNQNLTDRERELIRLYADGQSQKQAAQVMGISVNTAKDYAERIRWKLKAANTTQAVVNAQRMGLV